MKFSNPIYNHLAFGFALAVSMTLSACGKASSTGSTSPTSTISLPNGSSLPVVTGNNVIPFTAGYDASKTNYCASSTTYPNKPCVSVTICTPGTTTCQTINDILLDTGSYGLRIFKSVVSAGSPALSLTPVLSGSNTVGECVQYGDGTKQWGQVVTASVQLGGESAVQVPIQLVDSSFAGGGSSGNCTPAETSPGTGASTDAQFNGILGVGLFQQDCGSTCAPGGTVGSSIYYSCSGSSCSRALIPLTNQVQNPVALLPVDNNGVIVQLPSVALNGALSATGYLILGIGTESNNTMSSTVAAYNADSRYGEFSTTFNGSTYSSFLDTGSNSYSFPNTTGISGCPAYNGSAVPFFCPSSVLTLSAVNTANSGGASGTVQFQIGNFNDVYFQTPNNIFSEIGSPASSNISGNFDWGLNFFFGRNVAVGIQGKTSSYGSGPYWVY